MYVYTDKQGSRNSCWSTHKQYITPCGMLVSHRIHISKIKATVGYFQKYFIWTSAAFLFSRNNAHAVLEQHKEIAAIFLYFTHYHHFLLFLFVFLSLWEVLFLFWGASIVCFKNIMKALGLFMWFPDKTSLCTHLDTNLCLLHEICGIWSKV